MTSPSERPTGGEAPVKGRRLAAATGRGVRNGMRGAARRVNAMFSARGPGFRALAIGQAASVAGDTLITMGLAGTLFFQVPSAEARDNVALYLLLTLAPFALLGPVLGAVFARLPTAYRAGFVLGSALRVVVAILMLIVGLNTLWLYPLAFGLLVFSRIQGISRSSLLPLVVDQPVELVSANARIARIGVFAGAAVVPIGAVLIGWLGGWPALALATLAFGWATYAGITLPMVRPLSTGPDDRPRSERGRRGIPRSVRLARLATAGVRFLNGFLVLLVAFEFRDADAGIFDFGALLGAAGGGFLIAAFLSPMLERRLREEPMVVSALAVEAAAAFIAAQGFGLPAAAALAAAAGLAWGTAKFGFDGLLQATVHPHDRGAAFVASETSFQVVWVLGAIIPVVLPVPITVGLVTAGITALGAQVVYISGLLVPLVESRRAEQAALLAESEPAERPDVTEYW